VTKSGDSASAALVMPLSHSRIPGRLQTAQQARERNLTLPGTSPTTLLACRSSFGVRPVARQSSSDPIVSWVRVSGLRRPINGGHHRL
jgi:hypothetical protein